MPIPLPPPVSELEARLGFVLDDMADWSRAQAALDDAATLILAEVSPAKASAWAEDAPKVVVLVALKAARREYENPEGLATESIGDRSIGLSETSGVYLTGREIAQVRRAASGRREAFVGTVRTPTAYEK